MAASLLVAAHAHADTTINFFGDVNYNIEKRETTSNSFQASTLDIFATQTEGKFSFIGEVIFEAAGENAFAVDVDRLEASYKPLPWLRFRAGRIRSAFGYYGDAYQNGKFFMTPVSWPEMYEGDGFDGILPSHAVGLHADAAYGLGKDNGKLTLDAEILNGRGIDLGEVPAYQDSNNSKAVNVRLRYVGEGDLEGLTVGGNVYVDTIPENMTAGAEHGSMHELILGAHAAYTAHDLHLIAEAAWLHHTELAGGATHNTLAVLAEAGYSFGSVTPYLRYESFRFSNADPYFVTSGIESVDHQIATVGVKYVASASVSLKAQGGIDVDAMRTDYIAISQVAFAF